VAESLSRGQLRMLVAALQLAQVQYLFEVTGKSCIFLLDDIGAKQLQIGSARVSSMHANFIINLGDANSHDVCKLISKLQETTLEKHNILLRPEIKPLGIFDKQESIIWTNEDKTTNSSFIITKE